MVTFGLEELAFDESEIRISTTMGTKLRYKKQEVSNISYGKWRLALGLWFRIELANGTIAPVEFVVSDPGRVRKALMDYGWDVSSYRA
jgi:hypothetical protein